MLGTKRIIVFIGLPGSGKGTISKLCVDNFGWLQLSTGDLCRKNIAEQTEIGKKIDFAIKSGKLVSDSIISEMVFDWLCDSFKSVDTVIFDGYPRTLVQANQLHDFLMNNSTSLNYKLDIVRFVVSMQMVKDRLSDRIICSNKNCQMAYSTDSTSKFFPKNPQFCDRCGSLLVKRPDDQPEIVGDRLETYNRHEQELLKFFVSNQYTVIDISADQQADVVFAELKRALHL